MDKALTVVCVLEKAIIFFSNLNGSECVSSISSVQVLLSKMQSIFRYKPFDML